jgi:hypothetical protein
VYTKFGQRIAADIEDGMIHFVDIDRGIDGTINASDVSQANLRTFVDREYLHNRYQSFSPNRELISELRKFAQDHAPRLDNPPRRLNQDGEQIPVGRRL